MATHVKSSIHVTYLTEPEILPTTIEASEEDQQEDIFKRAEVKQPRKHWKYVQEEDR